MTMTGEFPRVGHVVDPGAGGMPLEDAVEVVTLPYGRLLVLADPLPGAAPRGGATAVDALVHYLADARLEEALPEAVRNLLFQGFQAANMALLSAPAVEGYTGMAASFVATLVVDERAYVASAGVARLFLVRDGKCVSVTREPMPMPEGEEPPPLPPGAVSGVAASPLGLSQGFVPDILPTSIRLQAGDILVLASDGLLDVVAPEDVARVAVDGPAEVAAIKLVELARQRKGEDNISVVLFQHSPLAQQTVKLRLPPMSGAEQRRKLQYAAIGGVLLFLVVALILAAPWKPADRENLKPVEPVGTPSVQQAPVPEAEEPTVQPPAPIEMEEPAPWAEPEPSKLRPEESAGISPSPDEEEEKLDLEPPVPLKAKAAALPKSAGKDKAAGGANAVGKDKVAATDKAATGKAGATEGGKDKAGTDKAGAKEGGKDKAATGKAGTDKAGAKEGGKDKAGTDKAGATEGGKDKAGTDKAGTDKAGTDKAGTDKAGTDKAGAKEGGTDKAGTGKAGTDKAGTDKAGATEVGKGKAGTDKAGTDAGACSGVGLTGSDKSKAKEIRSLADTVLTQLKHRNALEAATAYSKAKARLGKASPAVQEQCAGAVDEARTALYREYLILAKFFDGQGKCVKANNRARDARMFGAPEEEIKAALKACYGVEETPK
jgi:serine/threonine protein phosphatase PrpC